MPFTLQSLLRAVPAVSLRLVILEDGRVTVDQNGQLYSVNIDANLCRFLVYSIFNLPENGRKEQDQAERCPRSVRCICILADGIFLGLFRLY